jgi:hypothetical protein
MVCPFLKTASIARNIGLLSKNAGRRITLGVQLNMMPSYSGAIGLSINPIPRALEVISVGSSRAGIFPV